jgi:hypothetical protein
MQKRIRILVIRYSSLVRTVAFSRKLFGKTASLFVGFDRVQLVSSTYFWRHRYLVIWSLRRRTPFQPIHVTLGEHFAQSL